MNYKQIILILIVLTAVFTVGCIDNSGDSGMEGDDPGNVDEGGASNSDTGDGGSGELDEEVLAACESGTTYEWTDPEADGSITTNVVGSAQRDGYDVCKVESSTDSTFYDDYDSNTPEEFQMNITRVVLYITENEEYASVEYYDENDVLRMLMTVENESITEIKYYDENGSEIDLFGDIPEEYQNQIEGY